MYYNIIFIHRPKSRLWICQLQKSPRCREGNKHIEWFATTEQDHQGTCTCNVLLVSLLKHFLGWYLYHTYTSFFDFGHANPWNAVLSIQEFSFLHIEHYICCSFVWVPMKSKLFCFHTMLCSTITSAGGGYCLLFVFYCFGKWLLEF